MSGYVVWGGDGGCGCFGGISTGFSLTFFFTNQPLNRCFGSFSHDEFSALRSALFEFLVIAASHWSGGGALVGVSALVGRQKEMLWEEAAAGKGPAHTARGEDCNWSPFVPAWVVCFVCVRGTSTMLWWWCWSVSGPRAGGATTALEWGQEGNKLKLSAMDVLARASMKDAAKCDTHCELQISVNHQISERIWRRLVFPAARLFQCLLTIQK